MKFVYIASPYTSIDNFIAVQKQIEAANFLIDNGFVAISPLLNSVLLNMQKERDWTTWIAIDLELLSKCDALIRLPGESKGADIEVDYARLNGIPVYADMRLLLEEIDPCHP